MTTPRHLLLVLALTGCGAPPPGAVLTDGAVPDQTRRVPPAARDDARDILSTGLVVDLPARKARATIAIAPAASAAASFEVQGLTIRAVSDERGPLDFRVADGKRLDVGVFPDEPTTLTVDYEFTVHKMFDGLLSSGVTLLWPYHCGNLFPCHSAPADGLTFSLRVDGAPTGKRAVYPTEIPADAPSYMIAWAVGDYRYVRLGQTRAGTEIGVWHLPGRESVARTGAARLAPAFEWYEATLGAYPFGRQAASVEVDWGPGGLGGMEHHPLWHVARGALGDPEVHAHEAAHGWFGDGVRIRCWEDFVLSEGTVSYLAARALEATGDPAAATVWANYRRRLDEALAGGAAPIAWPTGCNQIDILKGLFSAVPYMKGALFYQALERKIGRAKVDAILAGFYAQRRGQAAGMQDLLDAVRSSTGYDPTTCADAWLRKAPVPSAPACP